MARVIVGCSRGAQEPDGATVAYLTATGAQAAGHEVVLWLTEDGVRLAVNDGLDGVQAPDGPVVADLHDRFVAAGGRILVCPVCAKPRQIAQDDLVAGATLEGVAALMQFAGDQAMTFSY